MEILQKISGRNVMKKVIPLQWLRLHEEGGLVDSESSNSKMSLEPITVINTPFYSV